MFGHWYIDFRWKGTRYRERSPVDTKRGAQEHERNLRQQLLDGSTTKKEEPPPPTLKEFAKEFISTYAKTNNKPSEVGTKESILKHHLVPALGQLRLNEITSRVIERYKAGRLAQKLHPKTINNHLTVLRKMLSLAAEWEIIPFTPKVVWLKAPEPEFDFLDFAEAERLIAAAEEDWRAMIVLGLKAGLRQGELLALRWEDVDLVAGRLMVRRACM
jgi:integrase